MAQTGWSRFVGEKPGQDSLTSDSADPSLAPLRRLLETTTDGIVLLDGRGVIHSASGAARERLGLQADQLGKVRLDELVPSLARPALRSWQESACATTECPLVPPFEVALESRTIIRLTARGSIPVRAGLSPRWQIGVERMSAENGVAESSERLQAELSALLDSVDSGSLFLDQSRRIRFANDRFVQLAGLDARHWVQLRTLDDVLDALAPSIRDSPQVLHRWRQSVLRGDALGWEEIEFVLPSRRVLLRFARPVLDSARCRIGWLELLRDITGQRMMQSKLLQTEKMAALGRLVSGIAHELNNPLTSILGYGQLLSSRRRDAERLADARRICQEAERAGRIVRNLLLFAREATPERRSVNLNEIVERTLALRSYDLALQNISVEFRPDPDLPPTLGDSTQLQQVVLNLLVNAEQALQEGLGRGTIHFRTQLLSAERILLQVSDDGPGIPEEVISRIFDPFFTTKPPGVGTGLGLSIVYGIVNEHGGEVTVQSQPGHGATFSIELLADLNRALSGADQPPSEVIPSRLPAALRERRHILVVEDEPTVAQLIDDVLTEEGHAVEAVLDGRQGLDRAQQREFDLIICDLKMPGLDGRAFHRELMRVARPAARRILFVTGDVLAPHTMKFLEECGLPFVAKPFLIEELKSAVQRCLEKAVVDAPSAVGYPAVARPRSTSRKR